MQNINNNKKGFTIIETMISISIFIIVVMIGMGALLNANLLHNKSQNMRSIMDNLSFIMEDMGRNLRIGSNYYCIPTGVTPPVGTPNPVTQSCTIGGGISFQSAPPTSQWVYFIGTYGGKSGIFRSVDGATKFVQLTPDEVVIDTVASGFSVLGAEPPIYNADGTISRTAPSDLQQPFVTIRLVGTITYNGVVTPFSLQTSVSQRVIDI